MFINKQQYKRLTIVLFIPLIIFGIYVSYDVKTMKHWVTNCYSYEDNFNIYSSCNIQKNYQKNGGTINNVSLGISPQIIAKISSNHAFEDDLESFLRFRNSELDEKQSDHSLYLKDDAEVYFKDPLDKELVILAIKEGQKYTNTVIFYNISFTLFIILIPFLLYLIASLLIYITYKISLKVFNFIKNG